MQTDGKKLAGEKEELEAKLNKANSQIHFNNEKFKSYEEVINSLKEEKNQVDLLIKNLKDNQESEIQLLRKELQTERETRSKILDELKSKCQGFENKINEHTNEKNKIIKEYIEKIESLENKLQLEIKNKNQLINEASSQNKSKILEQESKFKEEIERLKFSNTLTQNEIKLKYDSKISNLKIENMKLKESLDKSKNYEDEITKLRNKLNKNKQFIDEIKGKDEKFKAMQYEVFNKMKGDFVNTINTLQQKNSNLTKEINELQNYISTRPSKEEDILKIAELSDLLNKKDKIIYELKESMNNKKVNVHVVKSKPRFTNASYGMIFSKKLNE